MKKKVLLLLLIGLIAGLSFLANGLVAESIVSSAQPQTYQSQLAIGTIEPVEVESDNWKISLPETTDDSYVDVTDGYPVVRVERWGGECWITPRFEFQAISSSTSVVDDKVIWSSPVVDVEIYGADDSRFSLGATEINVILKQKPPTNTFSVPISSQGLAFYYQPPLTEEYKDGWSDEFQTEIKVTEIDVTDSDGNVLVHRPDWCVGSYAVYHESKSGHVLGETNYMAGKAFHIPRPQPIDSAGRTVWADLHIENGWLTVTIPQEFLDTAKYPIYHALGDTFGYEDKGGSTASLGSNRVRSLCNQTPASAGTATSMSMYVKYYSATVQLAFALYKASDESLLGYTDEGTIESGWDDWKTLNFVSNPSISTVAHDLIYWHDFGFYYYYDTAGSNVYASKSETYDYPNFPNPHGLGDPTDTYQTSIYCTYTPGGGPTPTPTEQYIPRSGAHTGPSYMY